MIVRVSGLIIRIIRQTEMTNLREAREKQCFKATILSQETFFSIISSLPILLLFLTRTTEYFKTKLINFIQKHTCESKLQIE